jgi:hypothetical protein
MSCYRDTGVVHNNRYIDPSIIKTNIREPSQLDNFEPVNETVEPSDIFFQEMPVANVPQTTPPTTEPQPENFKPLESETFKPQAEVARFITKAERTEVAKKVKAMKRDGEVHVNVQASYQNILVLVQHVIIHCMYRNVFKKSFKHALNSAAKGIRNGTWTTPYHIRTETLERERLANEAKEREKRECQELGLGRMFGQAMRLTHGPSEADIAKFKADVFESGINSLGQNASNENIARLKALIQKTVEDKQKGCGK